MNGIALTSYRGKQHGFTLVEVIAALLILTFSLAALYESFGMSLRRSGQLRDRELAWLTAQSLLSERRAGDGPMPGESSGKTVDGFDWAIKVDLYQSAVDENSAIKPFKVVVKVAWGAQSISLESIELGRVKP